MRPLEKRSEEIKLAARPCKSEDTKTDMNNNKNRIVFELICKISKRNANYHRFLYHKHAKKYQVPFKAEIIKL